MKKEKISNTLNIQSNEKKALTSVYLPKMRTDDAPSQEEVESATGVDFPINMPNPAIDPIVSNNISNAEFDYTQDMIVPNPDYDETDE